MQLSGGEGLISLQGDTLQIQRLRFQTARNGSIDVTGSTRLDPAQGFPIDLAVNAQRALLVSRPDLVASVSSNIKINGSTLNGFDVTGPVTIDRAELSIAASQAASYPTVPVKEINGTPKPGAATAPPPPPPTPVGPRQPANNGVRLALNVQAPQAVFVRGRGLDAEVGGQFTVTGDPSAPAVLGNLTLRRGNFNLLGHRLDFTRGNVSLVSATTIDPLLDFAATTTVQGTIIEVDITGSSRAPKIELTSTPTLPQDEAMALLLFGKPSSALSPMELLSAAQALAELTGRQPVGGGFMAKIRGGLGLDNLSINSNASGSGSNQGTTTSVEGGRYVAPGVYVGARQGASARFQPRRGRMGGLQAHQGRGRYRRRFHRQGRREDGMGLLSSLRATLGLVTALIFLLVAIAMLTALGGRRMLAGSVFGLGLILSVVWLVHHMTERAAVVVLAMTALVRFGNWLRRGGRRGRAGRRLRAAVRPQRAAVPALHAAACRLRAVRFRLPDEPALRLAAAALRRHPAGVTVRSRRVGPPGPAAHRAGRRGLRAAVARPASLHLDVRLLHGDRAGRRLPAAAVAARGRAARGPPCAADGQASRPSRPGF